MSSDLKQAAAAVEDWFSHYLALYEGVLARVASDDRHRRAATQEALKTNASLLFEDPENLGEDEQGFCVVCKVVCACCLVLGVTPTASHWQAAIQNTQGLAEELADAEARSFAGSPSRVLSDPFIGALRDAGFADKPSSLNQKNKELALGLAINWGLRLLLASALEGENGASENSIRTPLRKILESPARCEPA